MGRPDIFESDYLDDDRRFADLTVENQNYVDYAMVLRNMLTEAMDSIFRENEERFSGVDGETAQLISELGGNIDWGKYRIRAQEHDKKGRGMNMMKAWEDHKLKGKLLGEQTKLISLVCKKLQKGNSVQEIAEMLEEDEAEIERICQAAEMVEPRFDIDAIAAKLFPTMV